MRGNELGMLTLPVVRPPPPEPLAPFPVYVPTGPSGILIRERVHRIRLRALALAHRSTMSALSAYSAASILAALSVLSFLSVLSIASAFSVCSAFSVNSILSLFSANSLLSVGCYDQVMRVCVDWV